MLGIGLGIGLSPVTELCCGFVEPRDIMVIGFFYKKLFTYKKHIIYIIYIYHRILKKNKKLKYNIKKENVY